MSGILNRPGLKHETMSDMLYLVGFVDSSPPKLSGNLDRQANEPLAKIHLILPELQLGVHGDCESKNRFNGLLGQAIDREKFSAAESSCSDVNN
jgi:hypothetical protein